MARRPAPRSGTQRKVQRSPSGIIAIAFIVLLVVCGRTWISRDSIQVESPPQTAVLLPTAPVPSKSDTLQVDAFSLPENLDIEVISCSETSHTKVSLEVRLSRRVTKQELTDLAHGLWKQNEGNQHERTFILYYLPGMEVGAGAWATTHFNPDLEVKIQGSSIEQDRQFRKTAASFEGDVVGKWMDETPFAGGTLVIFQEGETVKLERTYLDGSSDIRELVERKVDGETRYSKAGANAFSEYYVIDGGGNLRLFDSEGFICEAKRID